MPSGNSVRRIVRWEGGSTIAELVVSSNNQIGYYEKNLGKTTNIDIGVANNNWHHIALVHNNNSSDNINVYIDGTLAMTDTRSNAIVATTLTLGANSDGSATLNGTLDDVRFWNTPLTQAQIQSRMNRRLDGNEANLVRYYTFDHGKPGMNNTALTIARDKTSNNAHGTLSGFALTGATSNWVSSWTYPTLYADADGDGFAGTTPWTCGPTTGFEPYSSDCNDGNINEHPGQVWYLDADGDGYGNPSVSQTACSKPLGYVLNDTDCNDGNINEHDLDLWYIDSDGDGYGNPAVTQTACSKPSGYVLNHTDCNDNNPAIHSDAIEINVRGKNTNINDGDGTPSVDDDTQFGSQSVCLGSVEKIYTIQNIGTSALTISGLTLSGTNAGDFTVSDLTGAVTVAVNDLWTFKVTFDPSGTGMRNATVIITNDDCDEATYDFAIQGTGVDPEINVKGNGVDITNGGTSPSPANQTNFGSTTGAPITRTFTIENLGHADLYLADGSITLVGTNANLFSVGNITLPKTVNGPSGTITFDVTYAPGANVGTHTATVNITSNDCNEGAYNFDVNGTRVCVAPSFIACPTGPVTATTCAGPASCIYTVTADGTPTPTLTYAFTGATVSSGNGTGSGLSFNKGNTTVTVTASSTCMPAATCTFTVTVTDNEAPTITCAAPVTINTTAGLCTGTTTLVNPTATDNCPGGIGLSFDGENDEVTTKVSFAANANATIEAWINPSVTTDNMRIISNTSGTTSGVSLRFQGGKLQLWGACLIWKTISNTIIPANQWTHIAVVINGNQITGFINGVQGLTVTCNTQIIELGMGGTFFNNGLYYKGKMDEVRFWSVARTATEIVSNMNVSIYAQPNLVGLYHLNQGIAGDMNMGLTTAIDDSGNGNNGKLLNFELNNPTSIWVEGYVGVSYTNNAPATYPTGTTTVTWTATDASGNTAICNQTVTVNGAKINVKGNGTTIADGNTTPSTIDGTDFGSQSVCTGTVMKMYTIHNTSTVPLTVTGITKSGKAANDFTVGGIMLPATVTGMGSTTFTVTFDPSEPGARNAKINIANSDCNKGSYNFAIQGTGDDPEIDVRGNDMSIIMDGDGTPSAGKGTDFGSPLVCTGTVVKMYTIHNTGTVPLTVTGITKSGTAKDDFTIGGITLPATVEASGPPMTFTVTFDPSELGERNAKIQIANNDCDEATYNFAIQGTGDDNEPPTISCPGALATLGSGQAGTLVLAAANTYYQSFTANATGQIQNVKVDFMDFTTVSGNVTLNIYSGTPCSGTLIHTQVFTGVTAGYQTLTLNSLVPVTDGSTYYFSVTASGNVKRSSNGNPYSGGRVYFGCPINPDDPDVDMNFAVDISSGKTNVSLNSDCKATWPSYASEVNMSDNCGVATLLSQSPASPAELLGAGIQLVTMTATDAAGHTSSCTFNVLKVDNTPPTITCPTSPQTANLNSSCTVKLANYTALALVSDNCTAAASIVRTQSPAVGSELSGVGVTVVTLIATDAGGKSGTCTFNVNRTDVTVPKTITCPPKQFLELGLGCKATLPNYSSLMTATDNCTESGSIVKTQFSPEAGSTVSLVGNITVTLRATDASGKSKTCTFTVKKEDMIGSNCGMGPQGYAGGNDQVHALDNQIVEERFEDQVGQEQPFELEMYPNPTDGLVHLVLHGLKSMAEVTVFDPMGRRMVWQQKVDPALNTLTLNMAEKGFAEGLYFVMVRSEGATVTRRLVVAR